MYVSKIFIGTTDVFLFNVCIVLGFKFYTVINDLYEFSVKGNLPTKLAIKCNKLILNTIWIASIADLFLYIFFNTYWTFGSRNMEALRIFNFANRLVQIALIFLVTLLFVLTYRLIRMTLALTHVDKRQKNIWNTKSYMLILSVIFGVYTGVIFWAMLEQDSHTVQSMINYIVQDFIYIIIVATIFMVIITINLDFRLQT